MKRLLLLIICAGSLFSQDLNDLIVNQKNKIIEKLNERGLLLNKYTGTEEEMIKKSWNTLLIVS